MRGRKPIPTKIKEREGNPGKRPLNKNEPEPGGRPTCPAWLRKEAKREWIRIVPELTGLGLLSKIDRTALAGYCQTFAKWRQAEEFLEEHGFTYQIPKRDEAGEIVGLYIQQFPQVSIAKACIEQLRALLTEFGMTPASRVRLEVPTKGKPSNDPIENLLREMEAKRN